MKEFDTWNDKKKNLHRNGDIRFYHEREVWWCALGINIGSEEDGSGREYNRPVLIIRGLSKQTCFIVPLTTSSKQHPLRFRVGLVEEKEAAALLSQMRIVDVRRLQRKIGYIKKEVFEQMRKIVKDMF